MTIHMTEGNARRSVYVTLASVVLGSVVWMTAWGCGRASVTAGGDAEEGVVPSETPASGEPSFFSKLLGSDEPEPVELQVPSGTLLRLTLDDTLSSHSSRVGETFQARVQQEVSVGGRVAIAQGSIVTGRVTEAHEAEKVGGRAALGVAFDTLETADGESLPIDASLRRVGKSEAVKDGAIIAGATAAGAILGESLDKGKGGVVGGILGGIGGAVAAKETGGKAVEIPGGTSLAIELRTPMTVVVPG